MCPHGRTQKSGTKAQSSYTNTGTCESFTLYFTHHSKGDAHIFFKITGKETSQMKGTNPT